MTLILRDKKGRFSKGSHPEAGFKKGQTSWNKGIPITEEQRQKQSDAMKGKNNPNYGKHFSKETKRKISEAQKGERNHNYGKHHSEESKLRISKACKGRIGYWTGKNHTESYKKKMSETCKGKRLGENNNAWKGGITSFIMQIRNTLECRQWRSDVFTCDDFTCQECGVKGRNLNTHHIKNIRKSFLF